METNVVCPRLKVFWVRQSYGAKVWFGCLGLTALWDSISVYIGLSHREREKEKRNDRREKKMSKQPPPAPTASAIGPCPTIIQNVGRPGTGSLPRTIAPPDDPPPMGHSERKKEVGRQY